MKKLMLLLALVPALAACATETRVVVVTATPLPPTITPMPPTATPLPPTVTPEPWDAQVNALSNSLRELPHLNSKVMEPLMGGSTVDLLAVTEDRDWVQAIYTLEDGSTITGWLQVDKLRLNISLDDLDVDTETVFVLPPTRTPGPTALPLNERYIAHFVEQGFKELSYSVEYLHYTKDAGRGYLMVGITNNQWGQNPVFGFISRINATPEERDLTLVHLDEAASFIDPVDGLKIAYSGMTEIKTNKLTVVNGEWRHWWAEGETWAQFIHTSIGQEVYIEYLYEEENLIKVFFTYLPVGWQHPTE